YRAGTASQTFSGGLTITNGAFTSSTGPMTVSGRIRLLGGSLSGVGTVDSVAAEGGSVAPGGGQARLLTVGGAMALKPSTTLAIPLNGTDAGTGYSQLAVGGPVDLGGGALSLSVGFEPPIGSSFEILSNHGSGPINGTFNGLNEGTIFSHVAFQF